MAMAMDRSKYRNPDMPVGYVKKEPGLRYKVGVEIDGVHYIWAPYIYEAHIEEREDYATLSDLILSEDEDIIVDIEKAVKKPGPSTSSIISPNKIKKEKETVTIKQEPGEFGGTRRKKHGKKGQGSSDTSAVDTSLSPMDIDSEKHEKKKKTRKTKKDRKIDYRSDSSCSDRSSRRSPSTHKRHTPPSIRTSVSPSSIHRHHSPSTSRGHGSSSSDKHERTVSYRKTPSPSPERYLDVKDIKIKQEPLEQNHLFGSYICEVCNITMNSQLTYDTHVNGKRHRKNLKVKNVSQVVAQNIPATVVSEDQTKYPKPPSGIVRKKVQKIAEIQHVIENSVKRPCPGLNYVTEIQGIGGTQYYCSMCDCVCSSSSIMPHLTGYKHQLSSVKVFKPGAYEHMQYEPKFKIEKEILGILRGVQKKEGMGRMAVEVEELVSEYKDIKYNPNLPGTSRDYMSQPSTSRATGHGQPGMSFSEKYDKATVPNISASDYFCEICQSHMNSSGMWDAHIRGKRHLTNCKKMPGDLPSKTKTVLVKNRKAFLLQRLKSECPDEPIVGLQEIRETEIRETNSHSYQCFLCGSCHTSLDIIEHLISLKHRTKYLEHIDYSGREVICGMSDSAAYGLVREMCAQVEECDGTGHPEVHVNKSSLMY